MSSRKVATLLVGSLLLCGAPAAAKDFCLQDDAGVWVFRKVKAPKKPGSVAPLHGFYAEAGEVAPVVGTAYARSDGKLVVGVLAHGFGGATKVLLTNRTASFVVDRETFAGPGYTDADGNGDVETSDSWDGVDCGEVIIP
jgi:hypothetical protein